MPVGRPAGGVAVDFHVAAAAPAIGEGDRGLLKIGAGVHVPAPGGMDGNGLAIQGAQGGGTPAGVEPQAVQQFFRDQALPVERRFSRPAGARLPGARGPSIEGAALDFRCGTP